ncbi:MAG: threonine synthase [Caulobacteraceae bacterium]
MRYLSTRGAGPVSFLEALLQGLAPDGGLYIPEAWPVIAGEEIARFSAMPYAEVAGAILGRFVGEEEIATETLMRICVDAYVAFDHPAVAPLEQLAPGLFLLQLFHGPSLAFKDIAMVLIARLIDHALAERSETRTIVCATSGDTGGAAVSAFAGAARVRLVALFPEGRISEVQRRFMTTAEADNVRAVAVTGDFDACQAILKALFADRVFCAEVGLAAVNSINFARIAAQCVYYFTAAASLGAPDRAASFCVPTGNFGDAFAGWAAARMGLPVERIMAATNANAILARALETGRYQRGALHATQSPAMDIQVASNFERLYFEASERDAKRTGEAFAAFERGEAIELPEAGQGNRPRLLRGRSIDEEETAAAMAGAWRGSRTLIDPHTAVALAAALAEPPSASPMVVLATAHPAKFPHAVERATGRAPDLPEAVRRLASRPERLERLGADLEGVKAFVRAFAGS